MAPLRLVASAFALALSGCREAPVAVAVAEPAPPPATSAAEAPPGPGGALIDAASPRPAGGHLSARAVSVTAIDGCVVARDDAGHEAYLTTSGEDDLPALSPDGKSVAFRRYTGPMGRGQARIYRAAVMDGEPELLVTEELEDSTVVGIPLRWPGGPEFSLDGARVFFSVFNGELGALCSVDVATKKVRWVLTAIATELIRKGPYRGHFFAIRHEHDDLYGPGYDRCYVLHSVTGNKLRAVSCKGPDSPDASLYDPVARRAIGL